MPVLAPAEELGDGLGVGGPGVGVADVGSEELEESLGRLVAGLGDQGREHGAGRSRCRHDLGLRRHLSFDSLIGGQISNSPSVVDYRS